MEGSSGPYFADSTAGKTSVVQGPQLPNEGPARDDHAAHPPLHRAGDVVLDGFAGTGMTESQRRRAAALTGVSKLRSRPSSKPTTYGGAPVEQSSTIFRPVRRSSPRASTFPLTHMPSTARPRRFWSGWTSSTAGCTRRLFDGESATIDYTVWSEVFTCPHCGGEIVFFGAASDFETGRVRESFDCPFLRCGTSKDQLQRRLARIQTLGGDVIDRVELRPVMIRWRRGTVTGSKAPDSDGDRRASVVLRDCNCRTFRHRHCRSPRWRTGADSRPRLTHAPPVVRPRASDAVRPVDMGIRGTGPHVAPGPEVLDRAGLLGLLMDEPLRPDSLLACEPVPSGVYYVPSLHAEPSPAYNLVGTQPSRGKRQTLVKLWESLRTNAADYASRQGPRPRCLSPTTVSTTSSLTRPSVRTSHTPT